MAKELLSTFDQTLFSRSYLVTVGLLLISISILILSAIEGIDSTSYVLLSLIFVLGCSGQLKLVSVLEFSQYDRSDSLGVRPQLY